MPGYICAVAVCKSNSEKAKRIGEKISFHSFPTNKALEKQWIKRCYRKDKFVSSHKKICSKHFAIDDYEDAIQAKVMGVMPKRLKKEAVPHLNLLPNKGSGEASKALEREKRSQNKERSELIQNIMKAQSVIECEPTCLSDITNLPGTSDESELQKLKRSYDALLIERNKEKKLIKEYQEEIAEINLRNEKLQKENDDI